MSSLTVTVPLEVLEAAKESVREFDRLRRAWHNSTPGIEASVAASRERDAGDRCIQQLLTFIELSESEEYKEDRAAEVWRSRLTDSGS